VIEYYEQVTAAMGGPAETEKFFRLFMAPGMGHCSGGPGPNSLDAFSALEAWVEKAVAPEQIVAIRRRSDGSTERARPLCVYPKVARWSGRGNTDDATNFSCVNVDK
jgi:tannase/feruloyl esterase